VCVLYEPHIGIDETDRHGPSSPGFGNSIQCCGYLASNLWYGLLIVDDMIKNQLPVQELLSCSWLSINCHFSYLRSIFKHSLATEEVVSPETRRSQHREQEDTMFCSGFLSGFVTHLSSQLTYIFLLCTFVLVFSLLFSLQEDKFIFLYVCLSCLSPLLSLLPGLVLIFQLWCNG
jgi:hypothetical protein